MFSTHFMFGTSNVIYTVCNFGSTIKILFFYVSGKNATHHVHHVIRLHVAVSYVELAVSYLLFLSLRLNNDTPVYVNVSDCSVLDPGLGSVVQIVLL